jgi:hypothetical protein
MHPARWRMSRVLSGGLMRIKNRVVPVRSLAAAAGFFTWAFPTGAAFASCGAAFCTINTNWDVQGVWVEPGARADLRFEYIDLDQPRAGSKRVAVGEVPRHHDEIRTINRNWLASFDYTFNANWGVAATLPLVDRDHSHIHNHRGEQLYEIWDFTRIGDARVLGRYQFAPWTIENTASPLTSVAGILFGVKLPTGPYKVRNDNGDLAERTLQPGTGTTDALLGAYFHQSMPARDLSWFGQVLFQQPLDTRDEYEPGRRLGVDVGLRYEMSDRLGLMLQLNTLLRARDSGAQAEVEDSGGTAVFLSPGVSFAITRAVQVYAFYQQPLYQYVNGVQLTANWAAAAGIGARF